MRFIGNLVWLLFGGILSAFMWVVSGVVLCITVVGIPFGVQCFKIAGFVLWPFGRQIQLGHFGVGGLLMNIIWLILFGWEMAITHLVIGVVFCVTVVGIPFGIQHFKLAQLGLIPFGARIG